MNICFVSLAAWSILSKEPQKSVTVGGAELQMVTLAKELAKRGHRVSIIVMDYGQPDIVEIDGIQVLSSHRPNEGLPILRFLHPRLTKIWRALERANADLYFQSGASAMTGIVAAFTKAHPGSQLIFRGASNADFDPSLPLIPIGRDRALFRWGIRQAKVIFVQTPLQKKALHKWLSLESLELPNALEASSCDSDLQELTTHPADALKPYVLWAGRLVDLKRPDRYIALAHSLPEFNFLLAGANATELVQWLKNKNQPEVLPKNLHPMGLIPMAQVDNFFKWAAVLVNTSDIEGFPNTFVQAWRYSVPTVSFFDAGQRVGRVVKDDQEMTAVVGELMSSKTIRDAVGKQCFNYFLQHHNLDRVVDKLESDLAEALA